MPTNERTQRVIPAMTLYSELTHQSSSMNNSDTELSHRKRVRDDNPSSLSSPEQNSDKKSKKKKKNKAQGDLIQEDPIPSTQPNEKGAEQNEQLHLCPNPNSVIPEKEQGADSNGVTAEHSVSDSTPQKRKRKKKRKKNKNNNAALAFSEGEQTDAMQVESEQRIGEAKGAESCEVKVRAVQSQVCHKHDIVNPVVQEKGDFVELKETSAEKLQLCNKQEHELINKVVEPRKENGVGKNECAADHPELVPEPDSTPLKDTPRKKNGEKKKENVLSGEGAELKESNNAEHPEVCSKPESASPIHTQHVIPIGPEVPSEPEQNLSKKKRRKKKKNNNALKNEVAEPDKHNGERPEIPVQRSICPTVASQTGQTISIDQKLSTDLATPIDEEQKMSKRERQKKKKSALKQEGSESGKHNSESTAEIPVSKDNVEQPVICNGAPRFEQLGENSRNTPSRKLKDGPNNVRICFFCGETGHSLAKCPDYLQVCFFCGEVGHTLAKCSVSQAGGRFAWCLLCYSHGHFTNKCPRNGHGIDPKVVAADGPVHKTAEAEGNPIAVAVTNHEQG